jgi:hypothetical protein
MPMGAIFWMFMILWLVFFGWTRWGGPAAAPYAWGPNILLYVLMFLLGWKVFGFVVS